MSDAFNNLFEQSKRIAAERDALRSRLAEVEAAWDAQQDERSGLYRRLAEAEALLREAIDHAYGNDSEEWLVRIEFFLTAPLRNNDGK